MIPAVANLVAATVMMGVIWFVQIVHYPLFALVGNDRSIEYARDNQRRTSLVVGPPMAAEGIASIWLFVDPPDGLSRVLPTVSGLLLAVVLLSTVLVQVPRHARLAEERDGASMAGVVASLVAGNWIRTIGWSARCVIAIVMVVRLA